MTTVQQVIGEIFDAAELEPDDAGELRLPGWLRIYCPTAERSAQTSASTVRTGFAAHAARAYSVDGLSWGLLVEAAAENLIDEQDLTAWALSNATRTSATTPAGGEAYCELEDTSAVTLGYAIHAFDLPAAGTYIASIWTQLLDTPPLSRSLVRLPPFTADLPINVTAVEAAWTLHVSAADTSGGTPLSAQMYPRCDVVADLGATRFWGYQVEARAYPSSFIGADNATFEREADTLLATPESIAPDGYFDVEITFAPQYAHDEPASDHTLLYFDDDNRLYYRQSDAKMVLLVGGEAIESTALTFSRLQSLTVRATHSATGRTLIVSGATTGNGTWTGDALDAIELPHMAYVLGTAAGAEEGAVLYKLDPHLMTFAEFIDKRALVQMDSQVGNRKFRDLLQTFCEQSGRFYDVCRTVKAALDVHTAIGEQLDKIGTIVGLPREGFADARYRVFLGIQIELLLAAAREGAEWTGTSPNILRIARQHVGADGGEVQLLNTPPYHFMLQIESLPAAENALLARFVSTAIYAGVLGQLIPTIAEDSVWQSAYYSPTTTSLLLDGVEEHVDFSDYAAVDFDYTDPSSGAIWFRYSGATASDWQMLISKYDDPVGWGLAAGGPANAGKLRWRLEDAGAHIERVIDVGANDDAWHCVGWTYDGSGVVAGIAIYFDGAAVTGSTSNAGAFTATTNAGELVVGDDAVGGFPYGGAVMHSAVWDVARSADEMALITGAPTPLALADMLIPDGSLVHWCTLGDGCAVGAGGCPDMSAQDKDGTAVNVEAGDFQEDVPQIRQAISAGGIWDSDVTPIPGAMVWQSVIETS